jgi:aspartate oxidase
MVLTIKAPARHYICRAVQLNAIGMEVIPDLYPFEEVQEAFIGGYNCNNSEK